MARKTTFIKKRKRIYIACTIYLLIISFDIFVNIWNNVFPSVQEQGHILVCHETNEVGVRAIIRDLPEVKEYEQSAVEGGNSFDIQVLHEGNMWTAEVSKKNENSLTKFNTYTVDHCGVFRCSEKMYYNGKFIRNAQPNEYPCVILYDTSRKSE